MAAAIDASCVKKSTPHFATVELSGRFTRGQMVVDYPRLLRRSPNVFIIDDIDVNLFKTMMRWSVNDRSVNYSPPSWLRLRARKCSKLQKSTKYSKNIPWEFLFQISYRYDNLRFIFN